MTTSTATALSPILHRIVLCVRVLLIIAFSAVGIAKLASAPQMVQVFDGIGIGQWFRYVTGIVEIVGGVLLLRNATSFFGGLLLATTMVCGVATHLFIIGGNPAPALMLALMSAFVAWQLRPVLQFNSAR